MRPTPFGLVFAELSRDRFPAIAERLAAAEASSADRDRFVLLEPVGRLLREMMPAEAAGGGDALEAYVRLLHHAYRHWTAGGWVYRIGQAALERAAAGGGGAITSHLPRPAVYLQLPALQVWGTPTADGASGAAAEPLDGMFVTETDEPGAIAVLGVFGLREGRPGFSAVSVEGRADADDPSADESVLAAARADGAAPFTPTLAGGDRAGILSVANAGELLLLTCRLLAHVPATRDAGSEMRDAIERIVEVS
jgi:hypothetical protein